MAPISAADFEMNMRQTLAWRRKNYEENFKIICKYIDTVLAHGHFGKSFTLENDCLVIPLNGSITYQFDVEPPLIMRMVEEAYLEAGWKGAKVEEINKPQSGINYCLTLTGVPPNLLSKK